MSGPGKEQVRPAKQHKGLTFRPLQQSSQLGWDLQAPQVLVERTNDQKLKDSQERLGAPPPQISRMISVPKEQGRILRTDDQVSRASEENRESPSLLLRWHRRDPDGILHVTVFPTLCQAHTTQDPRFRITHHI